MDQFDDDHRERRSRSRSPINTNILDLVGGDENNPSRRVPGIRGHLVYMAANGYTYVQNHTSTNRRQLRCTRYERGCHATASMNLQPENASIVMYSLHNHRPGHDVEIGQFLAALRSRVQAESTSPRIIYEEESRRYPNAAMQTSVDAALNMMRNVRKKYNPPVPTSLVAMGDTITSPRWRGRLISLFDDNMCSPFFQGPLEYIVGDETVFGGLIFANIEFLQNYSPFMRRSSVIAIDGTFGVLPRTPGDMDQLVTIHVLLDNISIPVVYAILNQRTELAYSRLWQFLRNDLPFDLLNWQGIQVITDYETALRNATRRVLPESQLIGCWFHFNQCIVRFIQTHDLMILVRNNPHIATIVRMFMALPHLPPERLQEYPENFHILGGFLEVQRLARDMNVAESIHSLFHYFQNYWMNTVGPHGFSVYGVNVRTNNYIESFHSTIQTTIGRHPPLWTFYDRLRLVERRVRRETQQIINGHQVSRAILTSRDTNNQLLVAALQNVRNNRYDISAFLRRVAHSAKGYWDRQIGPISMDEQDQPPNELVLRPLQPPQCLQRRGAERVRNPIRVQPAVQPLVLHAARSQRRPGRPIVDRRPPPRQNLNEDAMEDNIVEVPLPEPEIEVVNSEVIEIIPTESENMEDENVEIVLVGAEELNAINLEEQPLPQIPGEAHDRCFVCWQRRDDVNGVNIVLPCGHGWCCDLCARRLSKCPICRAEYPRTLNINIMLTSLNNVTWMSNINSLMDPTGSNCICCWRAYRDVPNGLRYVYLYCGHGWRCSECIISLPDICEVCDDTVDGVAQMFIT